MTVYANIKRPIFKGFNTIWSLLTEDNRPSEESLVALVFGSKLYLYRKLIVLNMIYKLI